MGEYRAYILGIDGHRFVMAKEFSSNQLVDGHDVELWDCGRLVARLSPDGETLSPELAPSASITPNDGPNNLGQPAESTSLSRISKLVGAQSKGNPLLLGW